MDAWYDEHEDMRIRKLSDGWARIWIRGWEMLDALANNTSFTILARAIRDVGGTNVVYMNWQRDYRDLYTHNSWYRCMGKMRKMGIMLPMPESRNLWMINPNLFVFGDNRKKGLLVRRWNSLVDAHCPEWAREKENSDPNLGEEDVGER